MKRVVDRKEKVRAVGPIWLLVLISIFTGGLLLQVLLSALQSIRSTNADIGMLRAEWMTRTEEISTYMGLHEHELRNDLIIFGPGSEPRDAPQITPSAPKCEMHSTSDPETQRLATSVNGYLRDLERVLDHARGWKARADAARQVMRERFSEYSQAAHGLQLELRRMEGKERLRLSRETGQAENAQRARSLANASSAALIELLYLTTAMESVRGTPARTDLYDYESNQMMPALSRIEQILADLREQGAETTTASGHLDALRVALAGAGGEELGLVHALHTEVDLREEREELLEDTRIAVSGCRGAVHSLDAHIGTLTYDLREQVSAEISSALRKAMWLAVAATAVLICSAGLLSRLTMRRIAELRETVSELRISRERLVDAEELMEANRRTAALNRELMFQKLALDQACIYTETDANGRISYANDAFCALNGYTAEELIGKDHCIVNSGVHPIEFWKEMYRTIAEKGVWRGLVCNRAKDGRLYWTFTTNVAFRDERGAITRYASIRTDVTEQILAQRAREESERFARATVEALASHIAILDERGSVLAVNESWRSLSRESGGVLPSESGNYLEACDASESEYAAAVSGGVRSVIRGERTSFTIELPWNTPTAARWFMLHVTRFTGEGPVRVVVALENITEAKVANERLQKQAEELKRAREAAEAASQSKSEFLATMSHEIRTPLNGVIGALDLLDGCGLPPTQSRYSQIARNSAMSLLGVINDILDFSKIEAGKLELHSAAFCPVRMLESVMEMLSVRASEKGIELVCTPGIDLPGRIVTDEDRLRQVVVNLVGNAIKFTEKGTVVVRAEISPERASSERVRRLRISVTDTGIGIPADRLGRLFKPFSQADASMARQFGGTGLGLAICRKIAEALGGSVGVKSEPGRGSTFWFDFEAQCLTAESHGGEARTVSRRGKRVLVVDDCSLHREWLIRRLRAWGVEADYAEDGREGVERVTSGTPYELVLVDHSMPNMDGFEMAMCLRDVPGVKAPPMVLMSASLHLDPGVVADHGFVAHLVKPIGQSVLYGLLTDMIGPLETSGWQPMEDMPAQPRSVGPRNVRVLLAEDNEINRMIATEQLRKLGYDCTPAVNGQEAFEKWKAEGFEVVLMDCQMPEVDGFEATRRIREEESARAASGATNARTRIIALTANALKGDREACLAAGMDDYVSKPIDFPTLVSSIEKVTEGSRRAAA